jgi:nitrous oxide reductase accessory protein NosL
MKRQPFLILSSVTALALAGCGKKEEPAPPPAQSQGSKLIDSANDAGKQVVDAAREVGQQVDAKAKEAGQAVGEAVKNVSQDINSTAKNALGDSTAAVTAKYQETVAKAQSLLKDARYQDALTSLKSLSDLKLTPEQQKVVADLNTKIQTTWDASKNTTGTATDAVKGLFK